MSHRNSHYWLWFLLFGVIPFIGAAVHHFPADLSSYTAYWLVGTGVLGLVLGSHNLNEGKLARPFDVIVGIIFTLAGVIGILAGFGVALGGADTYVHSIGLSTSFPWQLIFTFLGLKSLHHGLDKDK